MLYSHSPKAGWVLRHSMAQANRPKTKRAWYLNSVEAQNPVHSYSLSYLCTPPGFEQKLEPMSYFHTPSCLLRGQSFFRLSKLLLASFTRKRPKPCG